VGFDQTIVYVNGHNAVDLSAHPTIRDLFASKRLLLVLWEEFAANGDWHIYDELAVLSHAVLSFWGERALVLLADFDEFLVPGETNATARSLLASGCLSQLPPACLSFKRWTIFTAQPHLEPRLWHTAGQNPLLSYWFVNTTLHLNRSIFIHPKVMLDPSTAMLPSIHESSICHGAVGVANSSSTATLLSPCAKRSPCRHVPPGCAWLAHVPHMNVFRAEYGANGTLIESPYWLAHLKADLG
jgi:hypothetical protein